MIKTILVPIVNRNQVSWTYSNGEFREAWEFEDTLTYEGFSRGRSALNIQWKGSKMSYESGMSLLDEVLREGKIFNGNQIKGKFGFKKQGTAVLLKVLEWL